MLLAVPLEMLAERDGILQTLEGSDEPLVGDLRPDTVAVAVPVNSLGELFGHEPPPVSAGATRPFAS